MAQWTWIHRQIKYKLDENLNFNKFFWWVNEVWLENISRKPSCPYKMYPSYTKQYQLLFLPHSHNLNTFPWKNREMTTTVLKLFPRLFLSTFYLFDLFIFLLIYSVSSWQRKKIRFSCRCRYKQQQQQKNTIDWNENNMP